MRVLALPGQVGVLNALRHHRGRHTTLVPMTKKRTLCSTPCGIKEVGTSGGQNARELPAVLNALRHHRGRHVQGDRIRPPGEVCSTPCGITEVGTPDFKLKRHDGSMCSTPCGITEVGTCHPQSYSQLRRSAQRLAASQRSALVGYFSGRGYPMCSTPCGITEVGTLGHHDGCQRDVAVRNALRHHRGRHP